MRSNRKPLADRDYLGSEIHKVFAIHTRIMVGLMVGVAGIATTIAELI